MMVEELVDDFPDLFNLSVLIDFVGEEDKELILKVVIDSVEQKI